MNMLRKFPEVSMDTNVSQVKEMHVKQETFDLIASGRKTLEIRKDIFRAYTGDVIIFSSDSGENISVEITTTYTLSSVEQIFENDLYKKWLGNVSESRAREIVNMYFEGSTLPHELTVFEFKVVSE